MTHLMTLDDWDSDGINPKITCDCALGVDHYQEGPDECGRCGANLNGSHLCWFCDRNWIWSGP